MTEPQLIAEGSELGAVHLAVTDGDRARQFWTGHVGLTEQPGQDGRIRLGVGQDTLIVLNPGADSPVAPRRTGLYHVAIHVPAKKDLALMVARLATLEYGQAPTDHTATIATYFSDPDGNGIEITFETPERGRMFILPDGRPVAQLTGHANYRGVTEALDVQDLLAELEPDDDVMTPLSAGTRIGHVHLHLQDIEEGKRFYQDLIGFHQRLHMSSMGMSDFGLDRTTQPHSLAINSWNGANAQPRPEGSAGLDHWELIVPDQVALDGVRQRLAAAGWRYRDTADGIAVSDPSQNEVRVLLGT